MAAGSPMVAASGTGVNSTLFEAPPPVVADTYATVTSTVTNALAYVNRDQHRAARAKRARRPARPARGPRMAARG
eukprot:scaffold103764_cov60-Phaeocystis_antarctica.AAC.3